MLRYIFRGQTLKNGRLLPFQCPADADNCVSGSFLLSALDAEQSVDVKRFAPYVYDMTRMGWLRLREDLRVSLSEPTVDVLLEDTSLWRSTGGEAQSPQSAPTHSGGYFGVGIVNGKSDANEGNSGYERQCDSH